MQKQLREIDSKRVNGQFVDADGNVLAGSNHVSSLLERCQRYTEIVLERCVWSANKSVILSLMISCRAGNFPEEWKPIYNTLIGIRNELDKLSLTQAWSLRETDLYDFQRQLDKIDESRVDGNWVDEKGQPADLYVQRVCDARMTYSTSARLICGTDTSIPSQAELRLYLSPHDIIRACLGGFAAYL